MRDAIRTILVASVLLFWSCAGTVSEAQTSDSGSSTRSADEVERLVSAHTSNDRLQTERADWEPEFEPMERREPNPILKAIGDFFAWLFGTFSGLFKFILIGAIAAAILYALWYMFRDVVGVPWLRRKQADEPDMSDINDDRPARGEAVALLEQADALAAQGKFAEAVHLLLFRSIEDLRETRSGGVPQSLTAREIQSLSDVSARARQALAPIIRIVENSFFGGRNVDRDGWQTARSSYEAFAFGGAAA